MGNTSLKPLVDAIIDLPSLWTTLQQAFAQSSTIPGAQQLNQLSQFVAIGTFPNTAALETILLAPLTVISHVVELLRLDEISDSNSKTQI